MPFHFVVILYAGCDATCLTCTGSDRSQCTSCYVGYWLYHGYTGSYCHNCNSGSDCPSHAFCSGDSICSTCDATCATCSGAGRSQCQSCLGGWWLYNGYSGSYCKNCNSKADCPVSNSYCGLPDNVCYYCDSTCATCSGSDSSSCTSCKSESVLQSKL